MLIVVAACGSNDNEGDGTNKSDGDGDQVSGTKNIIETAQADSRFSVLVEALTAADLVDALSAPGAMTVFAPTNDAFTALLSELGLAKTELLNNKPFLTAVLNYHVLSARLPKVSVPIGEAITPLAGGFFKIDAVGADLVANDGRNRKSTIIIADLDAENGVLHAVDKVLLPADKNIVQTLQARADCTVLVEAVIAADLVTTFSAPGPLTVFAPTDEAFASLLAELNVTKTQLLANETLLTDVLTYHAVDGLFLKADVPVGQAVTTRHGDSLTVSAGFVISDTRGRTANIGSTDVIATNGVIHLIDKVILPLP